MCPRISVDRVAMWPLITCQNLFFLVAWLKSLGISVKKPFKGCLKKGCEYWLVPEIFWMTLPVKRASISNLEEILETVVEHSAKMSMSPARRTKLCRKIWNIDDWVDGDLKELDSQSEDILEVCSVILYFLYGCIWEIWLKFMPNDSKRALPISTK